MKPKKIRKLWRRLEREAGREARKTLRVAFQAAEKALTRSKGGPYRQEPLAEDPPPMPQHTLKSDLEDSINTFRRLSRNQPPKRPALADRVARMWIWMVASVIFPPLGFVGAWEAHGLRDETRGMQAGEHVEGALKIFWRWLIAWGVGLLFALTLIGLIIALPLWVAAQGYMFFAALRGLRRTLDGKPYEDHGAD